MPVFQLIRPTSFHLISRIQIIYLNVHCLYIDEHDRRNNSTRARKRQMDFNVKKSQN